ncbi:MAG: hypothetical protein WAO14_28885, partial [Pseudolabrys sp.]
MSALGQKQTFAVQNAMSALPPIATSISYFQMSAKGKKACYCYFAFNRNRSIISFAGCVGSSRRL